MPMRQRLEDEYEPAAADQDQAEEDLRARLVRAHQAWDTILGAVAASSRGKTDLRQLDNVRHAPLLPDPAPGYKLERRRLFNLDTRDLVQDISRVDWTANPQIIDDVISQDPITIIEEITSGQEEEAGGRK